MSERFGASVIRASSREPAGDSGLAASGQNQRMTGNNRADTRRHGILSGSVRFSRHAQDRPLTRASSNQEMRE